MTSPTPIDYTSKDFESVRASLLSYASRNFPEWAQASEGDFGMLMVELFAYVADIMSYYNDRVANEAFLSTASQRKSVLNLANMLAYIPNGNIASTGTVTFNNTNSVTTTIPAGTQVSTDFIQQLNAPIIFETTADLVMAANATGTVAVVQGETISNEVLAASDGTTDQQYRLLQTPVIDGTVTVKVGDSLTGFTTYTYKQHLIDAGPFDPVFTTWTDEGGVVWIQFGDNVDGMVPPIGSTIEATYRIGGGTVGNISAGQITTMLQPIDGVSIALDANNNPISSVMQNGQDAESTDQIRVNAPRSYRTQNRLITLNDFKDGALGVASVVKSNAVVNNYNNISVYIAGPGGNTTTSLINTVFTYLTDNTRKVAGATLTVQAGTLIPVNVTIATLGIADQYSATQVKNAVMQAMQNLLTFNNQDFGNRVPASAVYQAIAEVPGVTYAALSNLARNDAAQGVVSDVMTRGWEIPVTGTLTIANTIGGF